MTRFRLAIAAIAAALALGCTRGAANGPPSPQFKQAKDAYLAMLNKDGPVDIYTDPGLSKVTDLLAQVPGDSVDHDAAAKLQSDIAAGIVDAQKAAEARKQAADDAAKTPSGPTIALKDIPVPPQPPPPPAPDAGPPPDVGPKADMTQADFLSRYGTCFEKQSSYTDDKNNQGEVYGVNTLCGPKYPAFAEQLVLVSGGKVAGIVPKSSIVSTQKLTMTSAQTQTPQQPPPPAPKPAQPQEAAPPPPQNPNTVDQRVAVPDSQLKAPTNQNSDLDARTKMPGQQ
ncbi:MAG: hypothetical protein JST54_30965 [Deltaproteobacteria bacterium]|nr:hypothetical protein [Deltaproteobacteria bacterium]